MLLANWLDVLLSYLCFGTLGVVGLIVWAISSAAKAIGGSEIARDAAQEVAGQQVASWLDWFFANK